MSLHDPISPLRALYVQKVLPAVYDDSLSYYEVLAKTQEKLNEVISDTNAVSALVLELQQAMNDFIHGGYLDTFEDYLDEWFEENADEFVQRLVDEGIIPEVEDLQSDIESMHESIADLVASDASIRSDMVAADTSIRSDMASADAELHAEDMSIRSDMASADAELHAEDMSIRSDMASADTAIRGEMASADTAIRSDMVAADTAIRSDMASADTAIRTDMAVADLALTNTKVPYPVVGATPSYGTSGQVLATNADGSTVWQDPVVPSAAQSAQVITQWLNSHPEATTTVQDGSISTVKLADGAVTTPKLADGSVTDAKLAQSGGVLERVADLDGALTADFLLNSLPENRFHVFISPSQISNAANHGITVRGEYNKIYLSGTATSDFNIMLQGNPPGLYDVESTLYYYVMSNVELTGKIRINFGYFDASQGVHNGQTLSAFGNQLVIVEYPNGAVTARNYMSIVSGSTFNNAEITILATDAISPIEDISNIILNLQQVDLWNVFRLNANALETQKITAASKGITLTYNDNALKIVGTATENFSIQLSTSSYELSQTMTYMIRTDGTYTDGKLEVYNTYMDAGGNPHNYQRVTAFNEPYVLTYPSEAATSRDYINLKSGAVYDVTLTFFAYDGIALYKKADDGYNCNALLSGSSWNSALHEGLANFQTVCTRFSALLGGDKVNNIDAVQECETFLFFTDPHLLAAVAPSGYFEDYMGQIEKVYRSTPTNFVLCGGDWLGNSDTPDEAAYKMGLIDGTCRSMFDYYYPIVGNHDTNYQGKKDSSSATGTTLFPQEAINNLWYRRIGKAYYKFKGTNTTFYCFDTQAGTNADDEDYYTEQALWFMKQLEEDDSEHIAIAMHIVFTSVEMTTYSIFASRIIYICHGFNKREIVSSFGYDADYTNKEGTIEFIISGHTHRDKIDYDTQGTSVIPVIVTVDTGYTGYNGTYLKDATFDLVFVNYDDRILQMVRSGGGTDRSVMLSYTT